jgi:hypothetical protein
MLAANGLGLGKEVSFEVASVRVKNYSLGKLIKAHAARVRQRGDF